MFSGFLLRKVNYEQVESRFFSILPAQQKQQKGQQVWTQKHRIACIQQTPEIA